MDKQLYAATQQHLAGNFAQAANGYAAILKKDPSNSEAWHLSALLAHQLNQTDRALQQIQLAIQLNPGNAEYFSNFASMLNSTGNPEAALEMASAAISLAPDLPSGHYQLGFALEGLQKTDDAIRSYRTALNKGGDGFQCHSQISRLCQFVGDQEGAIEALQETLRIQPESANAYFQLSQFIGNGKVRFTPDQIGKMTQMIESPETDARSKNRLLVALGIHLEARLEYPEAYQCFNQAADVSHSLFKDAGLTFNQGRRGEMINTLVECFDHSLVDRIRNGTITRVRPLFIVGMPRSGSTLLQQLLAQYPGVSAGGELQKLGELVADLIVGEGAASWRESIESLTRSSIREITDSYLLEINRIFNRNHDPSAGHCHGIVIDKMPGNYFHIGFIKAMFPESTIIHCHRDPRAVCWSCFSQSFQSDTLQFETSRQSYLVDLYKNCQRLMNHWEQEFTSGIHRVIYENLLVNPRAELEPVLNGLGMDWSDDCLQFFQRDSVVRTASSVQVRSPVNTNAKSKWKHYRQWFTTCLDGLKNEVQDFETMLTQTDST